MYSYEENKGGKLSFKIQLVINIIMSYRQDQRKCCSFLFMELSVFIEDSVFVQFTRSFAVRLGYKNEVCGSTPLISQARITARH